jgi:hypothetical protein
MRDDSSFYGIRLDGASVDLDDERSRLAADIKALDARDPLAARPLLARHVLAFAESEFGVSVDEVLDLEDWEDQRSLSAQQLRSIIAAACETNHIKPARYWSMLRSRILVARDRLTKQIARRDTNVAAAAELATIPDASRRVTLVRYEAHISRQFYRALHELQRIQLARTASQPRPPQPRAELNADLVSPLEPEDSGAQPIKASDPASVTLASSAPHPFLASQRSRTLPATATRPPQPLPQVHFPSASGARWQLPQPRSQGHALRRPFTPSPRGEGAGG